MKAPLAPVELDTTSKVASGVESPIPTLPLLSIVNISPSVEFYDAVVGLRGAYNINENWFIPYAFDIGGGDSDLTWQALTSLGYRFDWGDVLLTYRYIHYDKSDGLVEDFDLYGPKIGVVFHF